MRLIDADTLLEKKQKFWIDTPAVFDHSDGYYVTAVYTSDIEKAPTIDVNSEPIYHAKWLQFTLGSVITYCSRCGASGNQRYKYCPNCGATMDEER